MPEISVDEIVQKALTLGILEQNQLQDVWTSFGTQNIEVEPFLLSLLRQGHLTKYQVDRLKSGESTGFYYGEYKVLYPVGAGSFARVYRAVHPKTEKVVAVKVLRNRYASDPEAVDLFIREAELGMGFRHPNIVPVHEVISLKSIHFMVMDFIEGQTLREFTNIRKKVDPKVATRIATDICMGLDYAFKRGQLHRDLKMTNVLVSSGGKALLCDFGLAASDKENEPDRKNQRAIDYAALERSTGVRRDDKRSDIFFLGTIYYHMLTGFPPLIEARDRAKRLDKTRFMNIKPASQKDPTIPFAISFIVDKAMNLDPEKRYQSPAAMLVDLEVAAKKLEAGTANEDPTSRQNRLASASSLSLAHVAKKESQLATVMIVEANPEMQNIFRESLKKTGFRVLVLSSAERALERFDDHDQEIDCVLFNAQSLGTKAVAAFNELANQRTTENVPAILLLDENQIKWAAKAKRARHRVAVGMPVTMKRLQEVLLKLIADKRHAEMASRSAVDISPSRIGLRSASSISNPAISAATASNVALASDAAKAQNPSETRDEPVFAAKSRINLSEDDEDPDYIAYIQGGGGGSMTQGGSMAEMFDLALDDAVDTLVQKVNAMMGHSEGEKVKVGISAEEFLSAGGEMNAQSSPSAANDSEPNNDEVGYDYSDDDDL